MKKKKMNNKGSTMVEVLVAFLLVTIILAALYQVIQFSSRMYLKSVDMKRQMEAFEAAMYKKPIDPAELVTNESAAMTVTLVLDTTQGAGATETGNALSAGNMMVNNIKIVSYEEVNEGATGYKVNVFRFEAAY